MFGNSYEIEKMTNYHREAIKEEVEAFRQHTNCRCLFCTIERYLLLIAKKICHWSGM
jgi:hypothetical protein